MRRFLIFACLLPATSCGGGRPNPVAPVTPTPAVAPAPAPPNTGLGYWSGDARVVSASAGKACGWGTTPGETRTGVQWRVTINGASVLLEEDMENWPTDHIPFSGTLTGRNFTATYVQGSDYLSYVCQFKGAELSGSFSADFSSFEAEETLVWGPPGAETVVKRQWVARR